MAGRLATRLRSFRPVRVESLPATDVRAGNPIVFMPDPGLAPVDLRPGTRCIQRTQHAPPTCLRRISAVSRGCTLACVGERRDLVDSKRAEINDAVRRHRGRGIALFGSVARGDDTPQSDIDFLVEFEKGSSLFDLLRLQDELEALLGCPVGVVSVGGLKLRDTHIRAESVPL
jgi:uncharacterized protein